MILFLCINKINNRLVLEIRGGYNIELQTHETMKIIDRTEWWKSIEVVGVVLVQCKLVNNQYQQRLEVSNTF